MKTFANALFWAAAVVIAKLTDGCLRKNGVPSSDQTTMIEYFDRFAAPGNSE